MKITPEMAAAAREIMKLPEEEPVTAEDIRAARHEARTFLKNLRDELSEVKRKLAELEEKNRLLLAKIKGEQDLLDRLAERK